MKYAFCGGKLLDGTREMQPREGLVLRTDGDRITDIVPEGTDLTGYEVVDLKGGYLMPGLINMHVHLAGSGKPQKKQRDNEKLVKTILSTGLTRKVANYGVAYSMCCCHFMEMQWRHAVCLHTGEYFHGPFETTDKKLPMILLMSEGRTRALDERCLKFLNTYAENFIIIDFEKLNGGKIDPSVAEFFNPVVMIPIERYYVSQLAEKTGHSMDERRYMWKVEY